MKDWKNEKLPRLLLISELSLSKSQDGRSSNPTLYNLFEHYPSDSLLQFIPASTYKRNPPVEPHINSITFKDSFFPQFRNRFGLVVNRYLKTLNLSLLNLLSWQRKQQIKNFDPEVLLICPITLSGLVVGYKMAQEKKIPFLIYFMDDWIAVDQSAWVGGNVQSFSNYLLKEAVGWIMISDYLAEDLAERYVVRNKPCLVAHNPVTIPEKCPAAMVSQPSRKYFRVAYAGSIQTMHADSLLLVAEAIHQLRKEGKDVELIVYTSPEFWNIYSSSLTKFDVVYGSLIPYDELLSCLSLSDLLLVCTSFDLGHKHVIKSSLLTKVTDYMAAGKPILSCGPSYSACNRFLEKWDCGLVCSTTSIPEIMEIINKCMTNPRKMSDTSGRALTVLEENFSGKVVIDKLYKFIEEHAYEAN